MKVGNRFLGVAMLIFIPASAYAQDAEPPRVAVLQQLYDCRTIAEPAERLACYDRQVGALETAVAARDIRVVDREQVREAQRGLFGISLAGIGRIFGGGGDDDEDSADDNEVIQQIEATLSAVANNGLGKWVYTLDNGQVWIQTDGTTSGRSPRVGQHVVIRRGLLGSFILTVEDRPGTRVRRLR
ncbi:MAG: hypothetical protein ABL874_00260 [Sphingopyxis sp.]